MYQEKYDEFQQTLTKSNDVFQNFKTEMDKVFCCRSCSQLNILCKPHHIRLAAWSSG